MDVVFVKASFTIKERRRGGSFHFTYFAVHHGTKLESVEMINSGNIGTAILRKGGFGLYVSGTPVHSGVN